MLFRSTSARVLMFGRGADADVRAIEVALDEQARPRFTLVAGGERAEVGLDLVGEHMVSNALAAAAAAIAAGVDVASIAQGLSQAQVSSWRMQVVEAAGATIINDAYNANPDSVIAALKALLARSRGRRSWAVLGPMAELGEQALREHDRVGRIAVRLGVGNLVVVGQEARAIYEAARHEAMPADELRYCRDSDEALALLTAEVEPGDVVLVKASRAAQLERVAAGLEAALSQRGRA